MSILTKEKMRPLTDEQLEAVRAQLGRSTMERLRQLVEQRPLLRGPPLYYRGEPSGERIRVRTEEPRLPMRCARCDRSVDMPEALYWSELRAGRELLHVEDGCGGGLRVDLPGA